MTDEAKRAREAALPMEAKKDSLRQTQDGLWKVTFTVKAEDMHTAILNAPMGTRYMLAAVEIGDDEMPIQRKKDLPVHGTAKRHFEAACQDGDFIGWLETKVDPDSRLTDAREFAKGLMNIQSANELLTNPEPWYRLHQEYQNRGQA